MRRAIAIAVVVAAAAGGVFLLTRGGEGPPTYRAVFDNAFGLTEGADVKAAGVRIGSVEKLDLQPGTARAVVTIAVERPGFGSLRTDVFCRIQPQSLIGEYFLNCQPGQNRERLERGATIPVEQTGTTVPPDLVNNIMRRPWRERLGLLLNEFGAGFATRGPELDAIIQRAVPALRETDRVLRILADNRAELRSLTRNADVVMARLAGNRDDVARFVSEARDTARASANQRVALADTVDRLPRFLRELRPTLASLGLVAERQTPALRDLRISAPATERLLDRLVPFTDAARPALRSLGEASVVGRRAVDEAASTIEAVRRLGQVAQDPVRNLRFVLEHLDDRRFAVEESPGVYGGGRRFTGLEALLQYIFVQPQAINIFDQRGYMLKLNVLINECTQYTDAQGARENPERRRRCSAALGPGAPGIDEPDPSRGGSASGDSGGSDGSDGDPPTAGGLDDLPLPAPVADEDARASQGLADYLLAP